MKYADTNTIHLVWQDNHFKTCTTKIPSPLPWDRFCKNVWLSFLAWAWGCFRMISILSTATDGTKWKPCHHGKLGPTTVFKLGLWSGYPSPRQAVEYVTLLCGHQPRLSAFLLYTMSFAIFHSVSVQSYSTVLDDKLIITMEHNQIFLLLILCCI